MSQNKCVICRVNNKHLRIYDLREANKPRFVPTKSVFGIALDPINEYRFASFYEVIRDLINFSLQYYFLSHLEAH